jgi:hypothetical protein
MCLVTELTGTDRLHPCFSFVWLRVLEPNRFRANILSIFGTMSFDKKSRTQRLPSFCVLWIPLARYEHPSLPPVHLCVATRIHTSASHLYPHQRPPMEESSIPLPSSSTREGAERSSPPSSIYSSEEVPPPPPSIDLQQRRSPPPFHRSAAGHPPIDL